MNIVKLHGGFGNQLFEYAFGLGLEAKTGEKTLFDMSGIGVETGVSIWPYSLNVMRIDVPFCTPEQSQEFQQQKLSPTKTKLQRFFGAKIPRYVKEEANRVNEEVWDIKSAAYFDGYWQSETYFKHIESTIREHFTLKDPLAPKAAEFAAAMKSDNSVSLHIRRGDYVAFRKVGDTLGVCGPEYFNKALETLVTKVPQPHIFIFSDDIEWAKTDLPLPYEVTYVSGNDIPSHQEMVLMSFCRHHILSNSSFSWWGAWLDAREDKIVLTPKPWFKDPKIENPDIVPSSWIRIQ